MKRLAFVLLALLVLLGCAAPQPTTRVADISKGDFYTNEEVKGLTQEARDRYCARLDAEILKFRAEADSLNAAVDSIALISDSLKAYNMSIATQIRDLDGEIRQLRLDRRSSTTYIVKAGDTLQKIASVVYGDSGQWKDIYQANKDRLASAVEPLKPGTRLIVPAK